MIQKIVIKNLSFIYTFFLFLAISSFIVFGSIWQGYYNYDPLHWGLRLSEAKDLFEGRLPYKEVCIVYGYLTTYIQSLAYGFGKNLTSIIFITSFCYAVGVCFLYLIAYELTNNIKISTFVIITAFLIHRLAILPWANYIAFMFLVMGIYLFTISKGKKLILFISGNFFAFSILSREGIAPAILMTVFFSMLVEKINSTNSLGNLFKQYGNILVGIFSVLLVFFACLYFNNLILYWYKLSVQFPNLMSLHVFQGAMGHKGLFKVLKKLVMGTLSLDFRWFILLLMFIVNARCIYLQWHKKNIYLNNSGVIFLTSATFFLISTAMHSAEIFRISTASIIGIIPLYIYLDKKKFAIPFFIFVVYVLGLTTYNKDSGNYFSPKSSQIAVAQNILAPKFLEGQRWDKKVIDYYNNLERDLDVIRNFKSCHVSFFVNNTYDAILAILSSPLTQYQIQPVVSGSSLTAPIFDTLREDLDYKEKILEARDIVVFEPLQNAEVRMFKPPAGFYVYKKYQIPESTYIPSWHNILYILVPTICKT
jgi:hypothetical protein